MRWAAAGRVILLLSAILGSQRAVAAGWTSAGEAPATVRHEGVTMRLVTAPPEPGGAFRGALLLDLEPGWKTYWIDPGQSGLPPVLDFSASRGVTPPTLLFPVPHRFSDGYSRSAGYEAPTAIAFRSEVLPGEEPAKLRVRISLGVCREVCIPVLAELGTPAGGTAGEESAALVDWAFGALPEEAQQAVRASLSADGETLTVRAALPEEAGDAPDLFVAAPGGWSFDAPGDPRREGGETVFAVPVLAAGARPLAVDALLVAGEWAVNTRGVTVDTEGARP